MAERKLLLIDDSETMREAIAESGLRHGWKVAAYATLDEVQNWLEKNTPDVVVLDWQLGRATPPQFAELLDGKGLLKKTLLLSAISDNKREKFIQDYGLAGLRLKPVDLDKFDDFVALPDASDDGYDILNIVEHLPPALDLLDKNLNILWSNEKAKEFPPAPEHRRIMNLLKAGFSSSEAESMRRLDWDGGRKRFLDTRMYKLPDDRYWLARDWRKAGDHPRDQEVLKFEDSEDRTEWHQAIALLLAERYGITRTRIYKVANLPVTDGMGEQHSQLVIPLFQSGGGFKPDTETWMNTGFLVASNEQFAKERGPEAVKNGHLRPGCKHIDFGANGTTRVQFPVRNGDNKTIALIALDGRLDHLEQLNGFDKKVVETAKRMASDQTNALSTGQWSLMSGLMEDIAKRMARRLLEGEQRRIVEWHNAISQVLAETFSKSQRSTEMTYDGLTAVCTGLADKWVEKGKNGKMLSGHIMGTSPWDANRPEALSAWFIVLMTDKNHWQTVAGWGGAYKACRQRGEQELLLPLETAQSGAPWKAVLIQDYKNWEKATDGKKCCPCKVAPACSDEISGWLAVPMQLDDKIQAMMVVHARHPHYFTEFRVKLLETAAKRLLPLLAAAQREQRARSVFTAAIMHEVKNEAHNAVQLLLEARKHLPSDPSDALEKHLTEIQHHLEGLEGLGMDALDIFQLGSEVRKDWRTGDNRVISGQLGEILAGLLRGWTTFYENTEVRLDIADALKVQSVAIPSGRAFKRVVRALLHNAFRHGLDWVRVAIELKTTEDSTSLCFTISNRAYGDVAQDLSQRVFGKGDDIGTSTRLRGHLGLAVARQLVLEAHGNLSELHCKPLEDDFVEAAITLIWPVRTNNDLETNA
jgi:DNA-binding NarL/FixJ family response regulator